MGTQRAAMGGAMNGYHCEGCGRRVADPGELILRQRASGCRIWLCNRCPHTLALGTKPADVAAEVASDRTTYAGGPKAVT